MVRKRGDDPFDEIFERMNEMMEKMWQDMGNMEGNQWGYRMTKAPGQPPNFETFGDKTQQGQEQDKHETHVDVIEEDEVVRLVMDLPGVEKENIDVEATTRNVRITAEGTDRSYSEKVDLPTDIDPKTGEAKYNNGVLDLTFEKKDKNEDVDIDVE